MVVVVLRKSTSRRLRGTATIAIGCNSVYHKSLTPKVSPPKSTLCGDDSCRGHTALLSMRLRLHVGAMEVSSDVCDFEESKLFTALRHLLAFDGFFQCFAT